MGQLNESQIYPKLVFTDLSPKDVAKEDHNGVEYQEGVFTSQISESTQKQANLVHISGSTPQGKPVPSPSAYNLTPDQKAAFEYMTKVRALIPGVKEVKKSFTTSISKVFRIY